jgi:hypothetical protein
MYVISNLYEPYHFLFIFLTKAVHDWKLNDLPDPQDVYARLSSQYNFSSMSIIPPNVRDSNGLIIHPAEYGLKLVDNSVVFAEVYLKL